MCVLCTVTEVTTLVEYIVQPTVKVTHHKQISMSRISEVSLNI